MNYVKKILIWFILSISIISAGNRNIPPEIAQQDMLTNYYLNDVFASSELKDKIPYRYAPWRAIDGNKDTAWVEGKSDDGIGEKIVFYDLSGKDMPIQKIGIWPGFAKNKNLYLDNNRPHIVKVEFFDTDFSYNISEKAMSDLLSENHIKILKAITITLEDKNEMQYFDISEHSEKNLYSVCITIESVYKGSKYRDTCISEIKMFRKDGSEIFEERRKRWRGEFYPGGGGN